MNYDIIDRLLTVNLPFQYGCVRSGPSKTTLYYTDGGNTDGIYSVANNGTGPVTFHPLKDENGNSITIIGFAIDRTQSILFGIKAQGGSIYKWSLNNLSANGTLLVSNSSNTLTNNIECDGTYVYFSTRHGPVQRMLYNGSGLTTLLPAQVGIEISSLHVCSDGSLLVGTFVINTNPVQLVVYRVFSNATSTLVYARISFALDAIRDIIQIDQTGDIYYVQGNALFKNNVLYAGVETLTTTNSGDGGPVTNATFSLLTSLTYDTLGRILLFTPTELRFYYPLLRPYPTPPPPPQQSVNCLDRYPIPNASKKPIYTFNRREFWSWGANQTGRNCVPGDTFIQQ